MRHQLVRGAACPNHPVIMRLGGRREASVVGGKGEDEYLAFITAFAAVCNWLEVRADLLICNHVRPTLSRALCTLKISLLTLRIGS
jgi:hypothetical protein